MRLWGLIWRPSDQKIEILLGLSRVLRVDWPLIAVREMSAIAFVQLASPIGSIRYLTKHAESRFFDLRCRPSRPRVAFRPSHLKCRWLKTDDGGRDGRKRSARGRIVRRVLVVVAALLVAAGIAFGAYVSDYSRAGSAAQEIISAGAAADATIRVDEETRLLPWATRRPNTASCFTRAERSRPRRMFRLPPSWRGAAFSA